MSIRAVILSRNEEAIIGRCLESAAAICDSAVVIDTGSTDRTIAVAGGQLGAQIIERPWISFGANRTQAIELAQNGCDRDTYLLMLDADMTVDLAAPLPPLTADAYYLPVLDGGPLYHLPLLLAARRSWRYVGATHEYLDYIGSDRLDGLAVTHHCDGHRRPNKFKDDLRLLEAAHENDPADARTVFYLANTLRDLGRLDDALRLYDKRVTMGGWIEEVRASWLQAQRLRAGDTTPVGVPSPV